MVLPLQKGVIYGPVHSRRLGTSLGLNLMPTKRKVCSFDCVYCHFGPTDVLTTDLKPFVAELPTPDDVDESLSAALAGDIRVDYVTFSGNGEPSLHPHFDEIVRRVRLVRDRLRPNARVAILSNSTGLVSPGTDETFKLIDVPIAKLDAGDEATFRAINRPAPGILLDEIVRRLRATRPVIIQTLFLQGKVSNRRGPALASWIEKIMIIQPSEVQVYSLDRPAADPELAKVDRQELEAIAAQTEKKAGVRVRVFSLS